VKNKAQRVGTYLQERREKEGEIIPINTALELRSFLE
jgi:hypothetical protein